MRIEWMRNIDRYGGRLLAYPLALFSGKRNPLPEKNIRHIIVSKYFGIGSIALSTPLLQSLRQRFPDAQISFLTFPQNAPLLKMFPFIDQVVSVRNDSFFHLMVDTVRTVLLFRFRSTPELFIDMEFFSHYSALVAWLSGSPFRVGFHTPLLPRGNLLTHKVTFNPHRYITEAFYALGQKIGAQKEYSLYKPELDASFVTTVSGWMELRGLRRNEYIVVSTESSDHLGDLKKWEEEKWSELVKRIVGFLNLAVVLTGVEESNAQVERIIAPLDQHVRQSTHNAAGVFSLGEFLALIGMSRLLITIDSGPVHLAQLLGIPCVALFGPETPVTYGPRGRTSRIVYRSLYCSPCCNMLEGKKAECTNEVYKQCMRDIEVEHVWDEVLSLHNELEAIKNSR